MTNDISAALNDADRKAVLDAIATIKTKLPFLLDLSPEERKALPKMGDKSRAFVLRALEIARQDDTFLARSFSVEEFSKDVALYESLSAIASELARLSELVDDTLVNVGSEAYLAALELYRSAKGSGKGAGLDDLLDRVGQRFTRRMPSEPAPTP